MIDINITQLYITYALASVGYASYLLMYIYMPIIEELRYVVKESFNEESINKTKRLGTLYTITAFFLVIIFAPYILHIHIKIGTNEFIKQYKQHLWLDIRRDILNHDKEV